MTSIADDGTVVVEGAMERRMSLAEYLGGEETNRPQELAYGILREPPAPGYNHQVIVGRLHVRLIAHVREHDLGRVILSPVDVILDPVRALVVQPDLVFISTARLEICQKQILGAPDLVIEVISNSSRRHDRERKVRWYRRYGVRECLVVDPVARTVEVFDCTAPSGERRSYDEDDRVVSAVLPNLELFGREAFFD